MLKMFHSIISMWKDYDELLTELRKDGWHFYTHHTLGGIGCYYDRQKANKRIAKRSKKQR